jgi:dTDP-4-dehydrorhamnose reductase
MANVGGVSWRDLAVQAASRAGLNAQSVLSVTDRSALNTALSTERGILMPPLGSALDRYFHDCEQDWSMDAMKVAAE